MSLDVLTYLAIGGVVVELALVIWLVRHSVVTYDRITAQYKEMDERLRILEKADSSSRSGLRQEFHGRIRELSGRIDHLEDAVDRALRRSPPTGGGAQRPEVLEPTAGRWESEDVVLGRSEAFRAVARPVVDTLSEARAGVVATWQSVWRPGVDLEEFESRLRSGSTRGLLRDVYFEKKMLCVELGASDGRSETLLLPRYPEGYQATDHYEVSDPQRDAYVKRIEKPAIRRSSGEDIRGVAITGKFEEQ